MATFPRERTKHVKNLVISPHCDDAMLSLGLSIINKSLGISSVINVFTRTNYTVNGDGCIDFVTKLRKDEEYRAMSQLNIEVQFLDFNDACIRQPYSNQINSYLEPQIDPYSDSSFLKVRETIRKTLLINFSSCFIFFPLGIGYHIDHRICQLIGLELLAQGTPVFFYDDLPYLLSFDNQKLKYIIAGSKINLESIVIRSDDCKKKLESLKLYRSQVDNETEEQIITAFNLYQGERIWSTPDNLELLNTVGNF